MVILQNCLDVLRGEQESCSETCSASSGDGKQFVFINVGDDTIIKQQEDPEPTTSTALKNDPVVSCMSVCIQCCAHCTDFDCCLFVKHVLQFVIAVF
jgi:hypothetical protein